MTISNRNVVEKQPVVLDPEFFLPPNVIDVRYVNDQDTAGLYPDVTGGETEVVVDDETTVIIDDSTVESDTVPAPTMMEIVSQSVRVAPDGRFVVDVVIEVEDIPDVSNFEVRLTKV